MWVDPIMSWLLKSPFHSLVSSGMMLVTVTGRKTGRSISTPTAYLRDGNTVWVFSQRASKWWRNLRGGANMQIVLAGKSLNGHGSVVEDEQAVAQQLFENFKKDSRRANFVKIGLDANGVPVFADCERVAKTMLAIKIDLV